MKMNVLQRARELQRYDLHAVDGEIGTADAFYFDERTWTIRYLAVQTGNWLSGRCVLISPVAIGEINEQKKQIIVELSRDQIMHSPPVEAGKPISREYEAEYYRYFHWPPYWMADIAEGNSSSKGSYLRSSKNVEGYRISASDGEIGHVEDFVLDSQYWMIRYMEVNTRNWWPGKHVLLNPGWIDHVDWKDKLVCVGLTRDAIENAPAFDPLKLIDRDYEIELFKHYGRREYWQKSEEQDSVHTP